ncbi:uncharacterized protein TRIADDRAFT_50746 [Trichoplax adhaerens]|uniref:Septin n=1 Tax=Trichoplax adhaerens TaxID=10228 RepID=B3S5G8_TRIAD|nr:hypothetical protein TRIADDRAFT_50746 [Trichoplax adhaerens]EDV22039.1 hypothetical protein TRIADDRAFT_50746 [Trichoplax adhaerens]|eukprot:XP_002115676.1 hypothetical protein TRIADDRAFT_50746 [Trichoplax adhaerens]
MTIRSLTSFFQGKNVPDYIGFANLPNQVHRKAVKKGFEFTVVVVGESGLGKSTLIDSLFQTNLYADRNIPNAKARIKKTVEIRKQTVDIEEKGVRLRLSVVDTPGFGDALNNDKCWDNIVKFIDEQYEKYLSDESGLNRRNITDQRVHCCLYFISPTGNGLKPLDIEFMKRLDTRVNIVPVIAKSDTLTAHEIKTLKRKILDDIRTHSIDVYTFPETDSDEDEEFKRENNQLKSSVPFAVVGSNKFYDIRGKKVRGRQYPWGIVEVENLEHCDFAKLRSMLIRTHMQDLKEVTHEVLYEQYRANRLRSGDSSNLSYQRSKLKRESMLIRDNMDEKTNELLKAKEDEVCRHHSCKAACFDSILNGMAYYFFDHSSYNV